MDSPIISETVYLEYRAALLEGARGPCAAIVDDLLRAGLDLKRLYTDLFQRSLYEVGDLWECNRISVATEHLATAITESLMGRVAPALFRSARVHRRAVVACAANEYHQIGGRMVADTFELHGWDGHFVGASAPASDVLGLVEAKKPELVCLSLSVVFNLKALLDLVAAIRAAFPRQRILVGGQAFRHGAAGALAGIGGIEVVSTLDALESIIATPA